jgi:ATP-dependent protease ClpP protease subunit
MNKQRSLEHPKPTEISYKFSRGISSRREDIRVVLKELLNFDTILTPDETVALGLADEIFHTS